MRILPRSRKALLFRFVPLLLVFLVLAALALARLIPYVRYAPQEGDIVFQSLPHMDLVDAIEGVTESPYSHCGVIAKENGRWIVIESIVQVRKTPLALWAVRGRGGCIAAYRLKPQFRERIPEFIAALEPFMGRPYDFHYSMDDECIYCSELIYKAYKNATGGELGRLVRLGDMNWEPHKDVIFQYEPGPPPLDRLMITPRHLSEAEQLEKVFGGDF